VWVFAFFALLDTEETPLVILAAVGGLVFHAMMYGPQAAFVTELFSTRLRYSGASLGYQVAGVLGGGLAPLISLALLDKYDTPFAICLYVAGALCLTVVALWFAPETKDADLTAEREEEQLFLETTS
jgi:MFS family permease